MFPASTSTEHGESLMTQIPLANLAESATDISSPPQDEPAVPVKKIWALFFGSLAWIPLFFVLGWFDTATELIPRHVGIDQACLVIAPVLGLLAGALGIYLTKKLTIRQRIVLPLLIMSEVSLGAFVVANRASSIVEGWLDFPHGKTHTRQGLIRISRAYQTHGKNSSQYIQTMPIWSNLEIAPEDFLFMQNNRRPGDDGRNPDNISSRGYFCAKVTVEESAKAIRILHAGSQKLPQGTVMVCPVPGRVP